MTGKGEWVPLCPLISRKGLVTLISMSPLSIICLTTARSCFCGLSRLLYGKKIDLNDFPSNFCVRLCLRTPTQGKLYLNIDSRVACFISAKGTTISVSIRKSPPSLKLPRQFTPTHQTITETDRAGLCWQYLIKCYLKNP